MSPQLEVAVLALAAIFTLALWAGIVIVAISIYTTLGEQWAVRRARRARIAHHEASYQARVGSRPYDEPACPIAEAFADFFHRDRAAQ